MKITTGRVESPWRWLIVGTEGVGKTTFASTCPAPLFLAVEAGTNELDVARVEELHTYASVRDAIAALTVDAQGYQTIVVDTVDALEALIVEHLCAENKWRDIEAAGYGKGYVAVQHEMRALLGSVERMQRSSGVNVLLVGHAAAKRYAPPDSEPYERYDLKMHEKCSALMREWVDCVFFAQHEVVVRELKNESKRRGFSTGERVIRTTETAAWRAKNRYGLPETMRLDAGTCAEILSARARDPKRDLEALLVGVPTERADRVRTWFATQSDKSAAVAIAAERLRRSE
jgi:hypothetical protein